VTVKATIVNGIALGADYTQEFRIEVTIEPVTNITGVPTSATAGTSLTLIGTVVPNNATHKDIVWTVEDARGTGAAIAPGTNVLTTTAAGIVTVKATIANGKDTGIAYTRDFNITVVASTASVIIVETPQKSITVTEGSITGSVSVVARVEPQVSGMTLSYQWFRNTINSNTDGTFVAAGANFLIPVTLMAEDSPYYYYCVVSASGLAPATSDVVTVEVIVTDDGRVQPNSVMIEPNTATIIIGETLYLDAKVLPDNAVNRRVTWISSNPDVASVNSYGRVKGVFEGTAIITVTTVDGGKTDTCEVTVTSDSMVQPESVIIDPIAISISVGKSELLSVTFDPLNTTDKDVIWSSSNSAIAGVNSSGLVTGLAEGRATITVTTVDGRKSDTCTVDVIKDTSPAGTPMLYFSQPIVTAGTNNDFELTFIVNSDQPFDGVECVLAYDSTFIKPKKVTQIPPKSDWLLLRNIDKEGVTMFSLAPQIGESPSLSGNVKIATVQFEALKETSTGTNISIIQFSGNKSGSSNLQYQSGHIEFTTRSSIVYITDKRTTLKARFQGRPDVGLANVEPLNVKWIKGYDVVNDRAVGAVIAEESVITDENGEAQIILPQDSDLTIWIKGARTLAVTTKLGTDGKVYTEELPGGDANGDNWAVLSDFYVFSACYGTFADESSYNWLADFNNDGAVGLADFYVFSANYGKEGDKHPE